MGSRGMGSIKRSLMSFMGLGSGKETTWGRGGLWG
jgi:hypothetical protein